VTNLSTDNARVENMIVMAERLIAALEADITALKAGAPTQMRTIDPEVQRLSAIYAREVQGFDAKSVAGLRSDLANKLKETTARFRQVLSLQMRMVTRVKNASEGIIKAVAEEVDRRNAQGRPYSPSATPPARPASAMVFNSVI
jgi:hypothetical protein